MTATKNMVELAIKSGVLGATLARSAYSVRRCGARPLLVGAPCVAEAFERYGEQRGSLFG